MAGRERKLPDGDLTQDFTICDNSVNRYGWRLLVEGIDLTGFLLNPVALVQHFAYQYPVGKWTDIRVENEKLLGTLLFDRNDDEAIKLYWKYKDDFMRAVSLNVIPREESGDPKLLLPGQNSPTISKSELLEVSLVTIPGQKNAVKLSTPEGGEYKLNFITKKQTMSKPEKTIEDIQAELETSKKLNAENLVLRHKERGVVQDAEVEHLKELALSNYETISKMLDARTVPAAPAGNDAKDKAVALVALHFQRGAVTAEQKAFYENSATLDYEGTKKALEALKGADGLATFVQGLEQGTGTGAGADDKRKDWKYLDWFKQDPDGLALMQKNEPEKHKTLVADFENESKALGIKTTQD